MTEEVGAVTGDLEVATRSLAAEDIEVTVRYAGADEWYSVEGSPIKLGKVGGLPPSKLRELHERLVRHLTTPGKVVDGRAGHLTPRFLPPIRRRIRVNGSQNGYIPRAAGSQSKAESALS